MSVDWQRMLSEHPQGADSDQIAFWDAQLAERPEILHRLLADVYQATYGSERPPTLEDLWELMAVKRFSTQPFGEAVLDLLGNRSVRWLAQQVKVAHPVLGRYLNGTRPIVSLHDHSGSMRRMESIAEALKVHPSYFVEWRRLWIMQLLDTAFTRQPSLSVGIFRRFAGFADANVCSGGRAS